MTFKLFKMIAVFLFIFSSFAKANDSLTIVTFQFKKKSDRDLAARFSHLDVISKNTGKAVVNSFDLKVIKEKIPHLILETKPLDETILKRGPSIKAEEETIEFPRGDEKFHTYKEVTEELKKYARDFPNITNLSSIGTTLQGRSMWAMKITHQKNLIKEKAPGIMFMGTHHAREHLSTEVPMGLIKHLLSQYEKDPAIKDLINTREITIVPMVNPDGAMHDIKGRRYKMWRKNMRKERNDLYGVDLNRNYGYKWGTGGSSSRRRSDVFMGPKPFSEPETIAVKEYLEENEHIKMVLSYHTFSELILYPWGHKNEGVGGKDQKVFEKMGKTMAAWTGYRPQRSSDLYIASGDTCDWVYGALKRFCFTFELTPKNRWQGGFYPGAKVIDRVIKNNIKPALYLIKHSKDPYAALKEPSTRI